MLREIARILAEKKRVVIVDTSNEIGGDGDIRPSSRRHGRRRMQVPRPSRQHETMIEAVENHSPEVIVIDEIGRQQEAEAARTINERGVQLIGTAHGNTLENLLLNPTLSDLVGGIESVTLSDEEARRRGTQKTVLERRAPPTFDVLIEIQERQRLLVHRDVTDSVDRMLRGEPLALELRYRTAEDKIQTEQQTMILSSPAVTGRRGGRGLRDSVETEQERSGRPVVNDRGARQNGRRQATELYDPQLERETGAIDDEARARKNSCAFSPMALLAIDCMTSPSGCASRLSWWTIWTEADVFVTLKSYYRTKRRLINNAEQQQIPDLRPARQFDQSNGTFPGRSHGPEAGANRTLLRMRSPRHQKRLTSSRPGSRVRISARLALPCAATSTRWRAMPTLFLTATAKSQKACAYFQHASQPVDSCSFHGCSL